MQFLQAAVLVFALTAGCRTAEVGYEDSVPGGLLVRVVDAAGEQVAGAEVRAQGASMRAATSMPVPVLDPLIAGSVRRAEDYGASWRTDSRGEVRVPGEILYRHVVARAGDRFGAAHVGAREPSELVVAIEREEVATVRCVDAEGRPAVGSLVWIATTPAADQASDRDGEVSWCQRVTAADGTLEVPHAQLWRALQGEGRQVSVAGFVWWGAEMGQVSTTPFPAPHDEPLVFTVSPHGYLDVRLPRAEVPAESEVWLRWLNPPPDPDDPDDVPEISFGVREGWNLAVPLGARFEVLLQVEGAMDPRAQFDGPTRPGERVAVALPEPRPAAIVSGRLVDEPGQALAFREFDAWFESAGARVDPDQEWCVADGTGRIALEFAPGTRGVLHVALTGTTVNSGSTFSFTVGGREERMVARVEVEHALEPGITDLGDVACASPR